MERVIIITNYDSFAHVANIDKLRLKNLEHDQVVEFNDGEIIFVSDEFGSWEEITRKYENDHLYVLYHQNGQLKPTESDTIKCRKGAHIKDSGPFYNNVAEILLSNDPANKKERIIKVVFHDLDPALEFLHGCLIPNNEAQFAQAKNALCLIGNNVKTLMENFLANNYTGKTEIDNVALSVFRDELLKAI